jgi:hypothetical protein
MNYQKIYKNLILKAKRENRNKNNGVYYEKHHIIPECLFKERTRNGISGFVEGNPEDKNNLILLTAREHFIAHVLLYKMYKETSYGYKIGSALSFFFSKIIDPAHPRLNEFNAFTNNSKRYERYRLVGLESISKANKGYINVRNSETGEYIGRVSIADPNYISGKYVHHTKGRKVSEQEKINRKPQNGSNNSNYKELTEERKLRLFKLIPDCVVENHLIVKLLNERMKEEFKEFKKISSVWVINNFKSYDNLIRDYNMIYNKNIQYNPYFRSSFQKSKSSENNSRYFWITDGNINSRVNIGSDIPKNFKRGRLDVKNKKD